MCYSYFATPTSFLPRALRGRRPYAGGDSRATAAVGGLRQSPGAGRMKPPLPVGHGQRLCPRGRAVAASLLDGVLWARPHRGAWLFAAFLGLAEATGGLPNKRARPGPLAPGALFQGASRPAAAPPGRWDFAPPPRRGRQGGKPGRSAGLGMADVGPGLSGLLQFCQAVFLWQKEQHPDFLGNKAQIYKL